MARKTKITLTPVDFYDGEVLAQVLEEKAAQGLHLREIGRFFNYYDRGEPKVVRYRVEYASEKTGVVDEDFVDYCQQAGWEYIGTVREMLHVLRAVRPDAEELHTDPVVRAMSMKRVARKVTGNAVSELILTLVFLAGLIWAILAHGIHRFPLAFLIADESHMTLYYPLLLLALLLPTGLLLINARRLRQVRKSLLRGESPPRDPHGQRRMYTSTILFLLTILLIFCFTVLRMVLTFPIQRASLNEQQGLIYVPLGVLQNDPDYAPAPPYEGRGYDLFAHVEFQRGLFTAQQYETYESGELTAFGSATEFDEYLPRATSNYYQLHFPALSETLARQLLCMAYAGYEKDCRKNDFEPSDATWEALPCEGLDGAVCVTVQNWRWLAVWKDEHVVFIEHHGPDNTRSALEHLAGLLAE